MSHQVQVIPADSILVAAERQRKDPSEKHIAELAKSIALNGLLHAISITPEGELITGFCRLSAIRTLQEPYLYGNDLIQPGHVPCLILNDRDETALYRLELEENLRRKNLTPVEEAQAIAKLHTMLSQAVSQGTWTKVETGRELDRLRGTELPRTDSARASEVADALLLDSFAEDPDIKKAASKKDAVRLAKKKLEAQFLGGLGALSTITATQHTLIHGKAEEELLRLPKGLYSGVIVDPPYGIDADTFGEQTFKLSHQYDDSQEAALERIASILLNSHSLCKDDAHLYMFCDIRLWPDLCQLAVESGWYPYPTPLIWHKPNLGHAPQPGYFLRRYEAILFAQKGARKLAKSSSDILEFPALQNKTHAAQKPVALYEHLMRLSFLPGEEVLDPCCGSGTIFQAASAAGLRATGIELDEVYYNQCKLVLGEL